MAALVLSCRAGTPMTDTKRTNQRQARGAVSVQGSRYATVCA